ncbi:unnamed protein product [Cochlearia groenlandica]
MKRVREDVYPEEERQRRLEETNEQPEIIVRGLTTTRALSFLKAVKERFQNDKEKYKRFLELMKDLRDQRVSHVGCRVVSPVDVIKRIKGLFEGHKDLYSDFRTFLPKEYMKSYKGAISLVEKVKVSM